MVVEFFVDVEVERFVVGVGVADGEAAVQTLDAQQLHAMLRGDGSLLLGGGELVEGGTGESRVVAQAVAVGDRRGEVFAERCGLHHLQPDPAQWQVAGEATECRAGTDENEVGLASSRATASSATATSAAVRGSVSVSEPFARKPTSGTRAPRSSHSSRDRRVRAGSSNSR